MMKYHHRLKAINRNERTRKYVFNMHDKPWIKEFIDIELKTNAVFYFFPLRSCSYNSLSLLISWRRVLFWSSRNEFLFSRFWTYCLFLLRFSCAFNRFFSFLKMKTLWSRKKHKVFWPYRLPVNERWRAWFFTFHLKTNKILKVKYEYSKIRRKLNELSSEFAFYGITKNYLIFWAVTWTYLSSFK